MKISCSAITTVEHVNFSIEVDCKSFLLRCSVEHVLFAGDADMSRTELKINQVLKAGKPGFKDLLACAKVQGQKTETEFEMLATHQLESELCPVIRAALKAREKKGGIPVYPVCVSVALLESVKWKHLKE